jgi:hypothetical protein
MTTPDTQSGEQPVEKFVLPDFFEQGLNPIEIYEQLKPFSDSEKLDVLTKLLISNRHPLVVEFITREFGIVDIIFFLKNFSLELIKKFILTLVANDSPELNINVFVSLLRDLGFVELSDSIKLNYIRGTLREALHAQVMPPIA